MLSIPGDRDEKPLRSQVPGALQAHETRSARELPDLLRVFEHQVRMVTLECLLASSEDELLEAFDVDLYEVDTCDSFALEE